MKTILNSFNKLISFEFAVVSAIAIVFQLYHGSSMMYEMRMINPYITLLSNRGIFNLPHQIGLAWQELAIDEAVSHTQQGNGLHHS